MDDIHPLTLTREFWAAHGTSLLDLLLAYALAFVIGWNREQQDRSAGLRTFPLVAVAACGFVQVGLGSFAGDPDAVARVVEGVITGIGFIGAGAILKGSQEVHGTATAASIWVTGAIGAAIGLGNHAVAIAVWILASVTLYLVSRLKARRDAAELRDEEARRNDARAASPP